MDVEPMLAHEPVPRYPYRSAAVGLVPAPAAAAFAYLDDHPRLTGHMDKPTWQMAGGRMTVTLDERQGRGVGARIRLAGRVLGLSLQVDEVVTVYDPPRRKVWATVGAPRLLVIGSYALGFEVRPHAHASEVRVVLDYTWPPGAGGRLLGWLLAGWYARWCTRRMLQDAQRYFRTAKEGDS